MNRESSLDDSGVVDDHDDNQEMELVHASTVEVIFSHLKPCRTLCIFTMVFCILE
jgi:hypothetical protein